MNTPRFPYRLANYTVTVLFILSHFLSALSPALTALAAIPHPQSSSAHSESSTPNPTGPSALTHPLSLSRVQSSYVAGQTVVHPLDTGAQANAEQWGELASTPACHAHPDPLIPGEHVDFNALLTLPLQPY